MKKIFLALLLAFAMCSCVSEIAKQTLNEYNEVYVKVDEIVVAHPRWEQRLLLEFYA